MFLSSSENLILTPRTGRPTQRTFLTLSLEQSRVHAAMGGFRVYQAHDDCELWTRLHGGKKTSTFRKSTVVECTIKKAEIEGAFSQ